MSTYTFSGCSDIHRPIQISVLWTGRGYDGVACGLAGGRGSALRNTREGFRDGAKYEGVLRAEVVEGAGA